MAQSLHKDLDGKSMRGHPVKARRQLTVLAVQVSKPFRLIQLPIFVVELEVGYLAKKGAGIFCVGI